jgi:hypothetical protein
MLVKLSLVGYLQQQKKAAINGLGTSYITEVSVIYTLLIPWTTVLSLSLILTPLRTSLPSLPPLLNHYRFLQIFLFGFNVELR